MLSGSLHQLIPWGMVLSSKDSTTTKEELACRYAMVLKETSLSVFPSTFLETQPQLSRPTRIVLMALPLDADINHEDLAHGLAPSPSQSVEHVCRRQCRQEIGMVELAAVWNILIPSTTLPPLVSTTDHQSLYHLCQTYFSATSHGRNTH
jgi:hypothetical protein